MKKKQDIDPLFEGFAYVLVIYVILLQFEAV